jgi:hypothetical protein
LPPSGWVWDLLIIARACYNDLTLKNVCRARHTTNGEIGKIFKMKAQAVSKAGIKIERLVKENRKIRNQVNKLISIFEG